jgi:hypothetical protein
LTLHPATSALIYRQRSLNRFLRVWEASRTRIFDELCNISAPHPHCFTNKEKDKLEEMFPILIDLASHDIRENFRKNKLLHVNGPPKIMRNLELIFLA